MSDGTEPAIRPDLVSSDLGGIVAFVAEFLAAFGEALEPGDLILSGSYSAQAVPLESDCDVQGLFGPLGEVELRVLSP